MTTASIAPWPVVAKPMHGPAGPGAAATAAC
jgi:hypothetical protein